jgi:hypothetical protein
VIVIHGSFATAVQLQPVPELTVTVPVVAAGLARFDEAGAIVNVQGAPAWVTVNVWPAIVSVPVRDAADVFAPTL